MKVGIYRHYKGNLYKVLCIAKHSETEDELVVYQALYGKYEHWVRPIMMFNEEIEIEGKSVKKFTYISETDL